MKKLLYIFFLILVFPLDIYAFDVNVDYKKSYGGSGDDVFNSVIPTGDGGYVIVGDFSSTNLDGLSSYGKLDGLIIKYDSNGDILWKKQYGGTEIDRFSTVTMTNDGGYVVVGSTSSNDIEGLEVSNNTDALIIKYDNFGNLLWQNNYTYGMISNFMSVIELSDNSFVVTGVSTGIFNGKFTDVNIIVKYDKDGNFIWEKHWLENYKSSFYDISNTSDDGFVVVGTATILDENNNLVSKGGEDAVIIKYDKDGNLLWQNNWGGNNVDSFKSVHFYDDGIIVGGISNSTDIDDIVNVGGMDAIIVKYDNNGKLLWNKSFGSSERDDIYSVISTSGNEFIAVGNSSFAGVDDVLGYGDQDATVFKFDKYGNLLWKNNFGGTGVDIFTSIANVVDTDFVFIGYTYSNDINDIEYFGEQDAIFAKYSFEYNIDISDEIVNGTSQAEKRGRYGIIKPEPNDGFKVNKIIVKDTINNEVEVSSLEDGTYLFDLYDDVIVDVLFKEEIVNPKTGVSNFIGVVFTIFIIGVCALFIIKNCNNSYEL